MLLSFNLLAEEHSLGTFTGTNIDLKAYDHSFAGAIKDFTAFGWVDEATFTSYLTIRKYAKTTKAVFKKDEKGEIGGVLATEESSVAIKFKGYDKEHNALVYLLNNEEVIVYITFEDFQNSHFINPTYSTVLNGVPHEFHLQGEACVGLSLHYVMMLLAALSF